MTKSKLQESRQITNNQNNYYYLSSSMPASETSYYERQTQLQETKAAVNLLEAAR